MPRSRWENAAVELFTEVTILEPLIRARIDGAQPEGLSESQLTVLMILARQEGLAMTQSSLVWMLGDDHPGVEDDIRGGITTGLISATHVAGTGDHNLLLTDQGRAKCENAIQSLLPEFEPALLDVSVEALEQAMGTLREIRRTLDNLPGR
jgi:DNA-binding MarR family transcriptional regulator